MIGQLDRFDDRDVDHLQPGLAGAVRDPKRRVLPPARLEHRVALTFREDVLEDARAGTEVRGTATVSVAAVATTIQPPATIVATSGSHASWSSTIASNVASPP